MTSILEGLFLDPRPERIKVPSAALVSQHYAMAACPGIGDDYKENGHEVPQPCSNLQCLGRRPQLHAET